jgi:phosphatidylserine/phosphatidylglycerophosphate/cardiolipin synthase-like enzyme
MSQTIANPLRNVASPYASASQVYEELQPYGPQGLSDSDDDVAVGTMGDSVVWKVADPSYRQVQAVWDGNLYIARVDNPDDPDEDKRVWLGLDIRGFPASLAPTFEDDLAAVGAVPIPRFAFYGNLALGAVEAAARDLDFDAEAVDRFLDLTQVGRPDGVPGMLPVSAGQTIGELAETALPDGGLGYALEFKLCCGADGAAPVYPDQLYRVVSESLAERFDNFAPAPGPDYEYDPALSLWTVGSPRVIVWLRDEWNHPMGQYAGARLTLTRAGTDQTIGKGMAASTVVPFEDTASGVALGDIWLDAAGSVGLGVEAAPHDESDTTPLLLAPVPSAGPAAERLDLELTAPAEVAVQAIDPRDWFPPQGGKGFDRETESITDVVLAAPHAPERYTNGNAVTPILDGHAYFEDLSDEFLELADGTHWLVQTGWWSDHDFVLVQATDYRTCPPEIVQPTGNQLVTHWSRQSEVGAWIFGQLWDPGAGPHLAIGDALPPGALKNIWRLLPVGEDALQRVVKFFLDSLAFPNGSAVTALNTLSDDPPSEGISDGRLRPAASHHTKSCVMRGREGLVAFVGGIDVNLNRTNSTAHHDYAPGGSPYHDVQCKLEGPAVRDVLRTHLSRWNDHPESPLEPTGQNGKTSDLGCAALGFSGGHELRVDDGDDRAGTNQVQIARTFGNCRNLDGETILNDGGFADDRGYQFAPDGDFTIESGILAAIKRAKRYIYIEDQYLANLKIATAVADKIKERKAAIAADVDADGNPLGNEEPFYVYLVMPYAGRTVWQLGEWENSTQALAALDQTFASVPWPIPLLMATVLLAAFPSGTASSAQGLGFKFEWIDSWAYLQSRWFDILSSVDEDQEFWGMHCLALPSYKWCQGRFQPKLQEVPLDQRRIYVHTKSVVVDDVWATIGSANMNVRSYTNDTEMNVSFVDGQLDDQGLHVSVRDYRAELWAEHFDTDPAVFRDRPGNAPEIIKFWRDSAVIRDPRSGGGAGDRPSGPRVYVWPHAELYVPATQLPKITWTFRDRPFPVQGLSEIPMYWWLVDEYGKTPWSVDAAVEMMPPKVGVGDPRFAIDGEDGIAYKDHDLIPH